MSWEEGAFSGKRVMLFIGVLKELVTSPPEEKEPAACVRKSKFSVDPGPFPSGSVQLCRLSFPFFPCSSVLPKLAGHKTNLRHLARPLGILIQKVRVVALGWGWREPPRNLH